MLNAYDKEIFVRTYQSFVECASSIKGFVPAQKEDVPYDITELANAYCEARRNGDELLKSAYISALMIRYWHLVPYLYEKSHNSVSSLYEVIEWVYDGIERACYYEAWNDPTKDVSKSKTGAEKCINQAITSSRLRFYTDSNRKKRRGQYGVMSVDDGDFDKFSAYADVREEYADERSYEDVELIEEFVNRGDYLGAIVLDTIVFGDSFEVKKKGTRQCVEYDDEGNEVVNDYDVKSVEYCKNRMYGSLRDIDDSYVDYFCNRYGASKVEVLGEVDKLKQGRSSSIITKCIQRLQTERAILDYVR